jgi:hypothetical protein
VLHRQRLMLSFRTDHNVVATARGAFAFTDDSAAERGSGNK